MFLSLVGTPRTVFKWWVFGWWCSWNWQLAVAGCQISQVALPTHVPMSLRLVWELWHGGTAWLWNIPCVWMMSCKRELEMVAGWKKNWKKQHFTTILKLYYIYYRKHYNITLEHNTGGAVTVDLLVKVWPHPICLEYADASWNFKKILWRWPVLQRSWVNCWIVHSTDSTWPEILYQEPGMILGKTQTFSSHWIPQGNSANRDFFLMSHPTCLMVT